MYLPPPIDLRLRLDCPFCHRLTLAEESDCEHCDRTLPEPYRERALAAARERRRKARRAAWVIMPAMLLLLAWVFRLLGN
ncbi:hypothetical protein [Wenzhouxiangella marina]|uniref:Uncharacterized protein n=1 Tax=Wenzhouxiangella marina TaxID=1579979 RepID=A0A0K0XTM6_9GAMM|nr:hypothetical protein [Wenzhouxiangella marina]AKS40976.1 hypothetical protein WM2015_594 [Wenzhouxiangella marina]MBB6087850.1 hypothetical protein [Wenzhouxiangella marina]